MPVSAKEPGGVHVEPPGGAVALLPHPEVLLAPVGPVKVLHQHVVDLVGVIVVPFIMRNAGKSYAL